MKARMNIQPRPGWYKFSLSPSVRQLADDLAEAVCAFTEF